VVAESSFDAAQTSDAVVVVVVVVVLQDGSPALRTQTSSGAAKFVGTKLLGLDGAADLGETGGWWAEQHGAPLVGAGFVGFVGRRWSALVLRAPTPLLRQRSKAAPMTRSWEQLKACPIAHAISVWSVWRQPRPSLEPRIGEPRS
jgi:hypothetical protein